MTYAEKLKNPRWQKKRLEILERDEFSCQSCGSEEETLHVHHISYRKKTEPWEYDNDELITLCEHCHKNITEYTDYSISIVMGRGYCIETAYELSLLMAELDGMNPSELSAVRNIIQMAKVI